MRLAPSGWCCHRPLDRNITESPPPLRSAPPLEWNRTETNKIDAIILILLRSGRWSSHPLLACPLRLYPPRSSTFAAPGWLRSWYVFCISRGRAAAAVVAAGRSQIKFTPSSFIGLSHSLELGLGADVSIEILDQRLGVRRRELESASCGSVRHSATTPSLTPKRQQRKLPFLPAEPFRISAH
jgi:hypothetical protein